MTGLLRNFKPIIETYIQKQQRDAALGTSPKGDDYFLSRLDLAGNAASTSAFADDEPLKRGWERKLPKPKNEDPFAAAGFAQALFPDLITSIGRTTPLNLSAGRFLARCVAPPWT